MIMVPGDTITLRDLSFLDGRPRCRPKSRAPVVPLHEARDRFERDYILRALAAQQGNISRTAEVLGVERSNLYRKMRAFGIAPVAPGGWGRRDGVITLPELSAYAPRVSAALRRALAGACRLISPTSAAGQDCQN